MRCAGWPHKHVCFILLHLIVPLEDLFIILLKEPCSLYGALKSTFLIPEIVMDGLLRTIKAERDDPYSGSSYLIAGFIVNKSPVRGATHPEAFVSAISGYIKDIFSDEGFAS